MINPSVGSDPRDEGAFRPFKLRTPLEAAEATGAGAEATARPAALPLLTFGAFFFFPSMLMGVGLMALRALGPSIDVSSAANTSLLCVGAGAAAH